MAYGRRPRDDMKYSPTNPHFFKIILEDTFRNNKLVGLTKSCDRKVWIDKGWPEFMDHYSLVRGQLLVFRYEENSRFNVLIFDTSAMEIGYPSNELDHRFDDKHDIERQPHHESLLIKEENEDDEFVEVLERFTSSSKTREKSPPDSSRSGTQEKENRPFLGRAIRLLLILRDMWNLLIFPDKEPGGKKFASPPKRRTWSVMYTFGVYDRIPRARFGTGWREFALDNYLKVGDVCVFVLTKSSRIIFEVTKFRQNGTENSSFLPARKAATLEPRPGGRLSSKVESLSTVNQEARAPLERAGGVRSANPTSRTSLRRHILTRMKGEAILEVPNGGSWSVLYENLPHSFARSCLGGKGWSAFVRESSPSPGDVCNFELIKKNRVVVNVSIFRKTH
ncbi:hypothetical protein TIFTF001_020323 [Ficus carica]|uniref:TF-B3 domain-containing protein n=1 Tax=Ficus carica TaxID=3494 RepID=A0AA88ARH1_FICCA|nr:hypothetical protein TIFTF001_020323 [Ficus carica]